MTDKDFTDRAASLTGPARALRTVAPDDTADLPDGLARSLYVSGAGVVRLHDATGREIAFPSGPLQYHPVHVRRVLATGTTATGIIAVY